MDIETLKTNERNTLLKWKHDIAFLFSVNIKLSNTRILQKCIHI